MANPLKMPFTRSVKTISMGGTHTALITDQLQLFVMGDNSLGQLGLGSEKIKVAAYPTLVTSLAHEHVCNVVTGHAHTII